MMAVFYSRKFNKALRDFLHATFFTNATTQIGDITFSGTGLDDLSTSGTYVAPSANYCTEYLVEIGITGKTTDAFKWSDDGGETYTEGVAITGSPQALSNGVYITFAATTGHTGGDSWTFFGVPKIAIRCEISQHVDMMLENVRKTPMYAVITGGQSHNKVEDCQTKYDLSIMAIHNIYSVRDTARGHNPVEKYITVNDMIDNLKSYIAFGNSFKSNMQTYGFNDNRILNGQWVDIPEPVVQDKIIYQQIMLQYLIA